MAADLLTTSLDTRLADCDVAAGVRLTFHDRGGQRPIRWREVGGLDWSNYAMVLGAGGVTGLSFEAGCLLALATDHRVRLGDASAVVGTSAGAIVGSLIALGFGGDDLAAVINQVDHYLDPALAALDVQFQTELPPLPCVLQLLRRPTIKLTATAVTMLIRRRFTAMLVNALRTGSFDLAQQLRFLRAADWPALGMELRLCATCVATGQRRVFTSSVDAALIDAVAASCAIPGMMAPVVIDGVEHVDGGLISPTNADVLDDLSGRLIVIVSPMSGRRSNSTIGRVSSTHARRRLASEVGRLRRKHQLLVIEPRDGLSAMVVDSALDSDNTREILVAAFLGSSNDG